MAGSRGRLDGVHLVPLAGGVDRVRGLEGAPLTLVEYGVRRDGSNDFETLLAALEGAVGQ